MTKEVTIPTVPTILSTVEYTFSRFIPSLFMNLKKVVSMPKVSSMMSMAT